LSTKVEKHSPIVLGLTQNLGQFSLLVLVNAFVGGMVGLERTVLPLIAEREFGIASKSAILSFIVSFGLVKAFVNLFAGRFSERSGRKKLLVTGWLFALPVPFMIMSAQSWSMIIFANVLLGINQGLCWSTTVIMKIDLVGPKRRGMAMGLNEFAGYGAVSVAALASGYIGSMYGLRPYPFYLGVAFATAGLLISATLVRDTTQHAREETRVHHKDARQLPSFREMFALTSYGNPTLFSVSQAGLVNNLNDGMTWGLFPLFFASYGLGVDQIGILAATYPAVWGISQIATGTLSDRWGRKWLIVWGMWIQAIGIVLVASAPWFTHAPSDNFSWWMIGAVLLGAGTALVYPTLLAAIGDIAHPDWRASAIGVYRFWRDLGYAVGAILAGVVADFLGLTWAIVVIGVLTFTSGTVSAITMSESHKMRSHSNHQE
jgi:MFS family permease